MSLHDRLKVLYLSLVILFSLGVFFYLLDTWGIINLEDHIPFLKDEPPLVSDTADSPSELEIERLRKQEEMLTEKARALEELAARLEAEGKDLETREEELQREKDNLEAEKKKLEEEAAVKNERSKMIDEMATRIGAMPPDDAVAIAGGWSNEDLVDVFIRMEEQAEEQGRPSIVPFLMTKLPRDRAAVITSLMMDERANLLPE